MTRGFVVHPDIRGGRQRPSRSPDARLAEAMGLAAALDMDIVGGVVAPVATRRPSTLMGEGKVAELGETFEAEDIEVVLVDAPLSPGQQRNLERAWKRKVLDRTGLILEIFGARAKTREGVLQVDLAHLTYQKSRLVRSWTHLERQRGGAGFMGGPGETQIEADRRIIDDKIVMLKRQLEKVTRTRALHRDARQKIPYPIVALVGYTNAGKSTLFNRLTAADVLAKDMLFATLDPTMRAVTLPNGRKVILSDTVGFISDLPTQLVAAFRATLEEVLAADLVVHVRDIAHPDSEPQKNDVLGVLKELGVADERMERMLEVCNKIDLLPDEDRAAWENDAARKEKRFAVSAVTGQGVESLRVAIEEAISEGAGLYAALLGPADAAAAAWLHARGAVMSEDAVEEQTRMTLRLDDADIGRFATRFPSVSLEQL